MPSPFLEAAEANSRELQLQATADCVTVEVVTRFDARCYVLRFCSNLVRQTAIKPCGNKWRCSSTQRRGQMRCPRRPRRRCIDRPESLVCHSSCRGSSLGSATGGRTGCASWKRVGSTGGAGRQCEMARFPVLHYSCERGHSCHK
eukprot:1958034-Amphidinium_carterae.1